MQPFEFKVVGLQFDDAKGEVRLDGKFHPVYSSQLFLKLPVEQMRDFRIGDEFSLIEKIDASREIAAFNASTFADGSPVPDAEEVVETVPLGEGYSDRGDGGAE